MEIKNILDSIKTLINNPHSKEQNVLDLTNAVNDETELKECENNNDINIKRLLEINNKINIDSTIQNNKDLSALELAVVELIKPQLKSWLQQNLSKIVSKIVEQEIQKILTK